MQMLVRRIGGTFLAVAFLGCLAGATAVAAIGRISSDMAEMLDHDRAAASEHGPDQRPAEAAARASALQTAHLLQSAALAAALPPVVLATLGLAWVCGRGLRGPLHRLAEAGERLRSGDCSAAVPDLDRPDELGSIATSLEQLRNAAILFSRFERQTREQEASGEASRLRDLTDAAFEGIVICDGDTLTEANTSFAAMLGATRADLVGTSVHTLLRGQDGTYLDAFLQDADGKPVTGLMMAQAGPCPVEIRARRLLGRDGETRTIVTARDLREQRAAEEQIRYLAFHDPLTGLGNRSMLRERLDQAVALARRSGEHVAALCVDLDQFVSTNGRYGQAIADAMLKEAARRLLSAVRETDTVVRLGGDSFVILQGSFAQTDGAEILARRVLASMESPFDLGEGRQAAVTAAVGIAIYPDNATDADGLIAAADLALRRVQSAGRSDYAFFRPELDTELRLRSALEGDLKQALALRQFSLAFQPQADAASGEIRGFEALLRWSHPVRGWVPAGEFIPLAEACGAMAEIAAWALRAACAEAAGWSVPLRIAVDLSPFHVERGDLAMLVETVLGETGLDPARLDIEITERDLGRDAALAARAMQGLKALGVGVVMDHFGDGPFSLGTLRDFAFDRVKLDQGILAGLCDGPALRDGPVALAVVRAVVTLAHALGIPVGADGVATAPAREALLDAGCGEVQGPLIGKPLPVAAFGFVTHPTLVDRNRADGNRADGNQIATGAGRAVVAAVRSAD